VQVRILVTGATGFIGRFLAQRLAGPHDVLAVVRDPARVPARVTPVVVDLAGPASAERFPRLLDAIVHLAQSAGHRNFPAAAGDLFAVNVAATARLLELGRASGVQHFVLASTGTVQEALRPLVAIDAGAVVPSFFAATKLAAETLTSAYADLFRTCILRLYFPYGPGQIGRLIPNLVERVRGGTPVELAGGCGMAMTPTYVGDIVDVFATALEDGWTGRLDVAAPETTTLLAVAEEIGRQLRVAPVFDRRDGPAPPPLLPDLTLLGRRYDLSRFRSFREGLALTLAQGD
jgi:nucleoside-diphosphate-sugar epimerase